MGQSSSRSSRSAMLLVLKVFGSNVVPVEAKAKVKSKQKAKAKDEAARTMNVTPLFGDYWNFCDEFQHGLFMVFF